MVNFEEIPFSYVHDKTLSFKTKLFNESFQASKALSLEGFTETILKHSWSPLLFHDNIRKSSNFAGSELIVLDVDDGITITEAYDLFDDYWYVITTTKSHQVSKDGEAPRDRFRVVLRLDGRIDDGDLYKYITKTFIRLTMADSACSDLARFYHPSKEIFYINQGKALNVDEFTKAHTKHIQREKNWWIGNTVPTDEPSKKEFLKHNRAMKALYAGEGIGGKGTGRYTAMRRATVALYHANFNDEEIISNVARYSDYPESEIFRVITWLKAQKKS